MLKGSKKIDPEEKQAIFDLISRSEFKSFMKYLDTLLQMQEQDVLGYNMGTGSEAELVYRKLRLEGAQKLLTHLRQDIDELTR